MLLKAKAGLTAKKVTVTRGGKTFTQTVWVKTGKKEKYNKDIFDMTYSELKLYRPELKKKLGTDRAYFNRQFARLSSLFGGKKILTSSTFKQMRSDAYDKFMKYYSTSKKTKSKVSDVEMQKDISNMDRGYTVEEIADTFGEYYGDKYSEDDIESGKMDEDMDKFIDLYHKMWRKRKVRSD
jgi:hypothetical protein